jgi:hypothetical protein
MDFQRSLDLSILSRNASRAASFQATTLPQRLQARIEAEKARQVVTKLLLTIATKLILSFFSLKRAGLGRYTTVEKSSLKKKDAIQGDIASDV